MDKLNNYQELIHDFFLAYEQFLITPTKPELDITVALDDERSQYILFKSGWKEDGYRRYVTLHVTLRNDKIWIEEDMTEDGIASYFLEQGVPSQDIVLGFQPPQMRPYTEFAVA